MLFNARAHAPIRGTVALLVLLLTATPARAQLSLSPQPALSIGSLDGDPAYQLHQVHAARRLGDGRVLVTMGPDLRFYSAAGRHLTNAGGRGQGPGEFEYVQDVRVLPGDTLLILHFRHLVWLDPSGKYVRQRPLDLAPLMQDGWFSEGGLLLPNGDLLAPQYRQTPRGAPPVTGLRRPPLRVSLLDAARGAVIPLREAGGLRQMAVGDPPRSSVQRFSPYVQYAFGAGHVYVGDNDSTLVHRFTLDGRAQGAITVADRPTPVTAQHVAAVRAEREAWAGADPARRASLQSATAIPVPSRHPYFGRLLVDPLGHLWVSSPVIPGQRETWTVFDADGRRVGAVTMPQRFTPHEIGVDYVLGVARDEDDVEFVRMYGLRRGR